MIGCGRPRLLILTAFAIGLLFLTVYRYPVFLPSNTDLFEWQPFGRGRGSATQPIWLIATSTPAQSLQRRSIIRSTWQALFRNETLFETRFVLANPPAEWSSVIAKENETHGDIIILKHLEESSRIANTVKSIEFLKYITAWPGKWSFVSKIDDDSFLDPNAFYKEYLMPLINSVPQLSEQLVGIGRKLDMNGFEYPGGQFYTLSWAMVEKLASLHAENPITDEHEDVLIGRLLHEADVPWHFTKLPNRVAFDYDDSLGANLGGKKTAWAKEDADLDAWVHAVGSRAINPHKMRGDEEYLRVAACYDSNGLKRHGH
ncbi:uncharacterized protein PV09_06973 [Verruconis gallopava]|uniref:Hexosyltransferase n=1 Tax=Verruconis gallopava TaxID=253628 RepID=A0A0D2A3V7_9PEZI|nr:uncharacterized protein PV09_06973 [Verruconis gallopava]KIW01493.1 hypothetical protein PV09_06973 [Verruconis gallopava]